MENDGRVGAGVGGGSQRDCCVWLIRMVCVALHIPIRESSLSFEDSNLGSRERMVLVDNTES